MDILDKIKQLPVGYSEVKYNNKKYGVTRTDFNQGKSFKIFAKELKGKDFVSLNYYITSKKELLKPCEMPEEKVLDFFKNYKIID
jgi:hypothetical protein